MDALRRYILAVTTAAMLCALVKSVTIGQKGQQKILGLICGVFLLATALSPVQSLRLPDLDDFTGQIHTEAETATAQATAETKLRLDSIITEQAATYILDKADALGMELEVQVELNEEAVPWRVTLRGSVSPYAKTRLSAILEEDLGIPAARQEWYG